MQKKLLGLTVILGMLAAGCAGTQAADRATVTLQVPTTVFVTTSITAAAPPTSSDEQTSEPIAAAKPSPSTPPPVGSKIPFVSSSALGDEGVATLNTAEWTTKADEMGGAPEHGAYLILDVTVEATKGTLTLNPLYWRAKDSDGRTYTMASIARRDPGLPAGGLPAGQKLRGFVEIDCTKDAVIVQMTNPSGDPVAAWSVPAK